MNPIIEDYLRGIHSKFDEKADWLNDPALIEDVAELTIRICWSGVRMPAVHQSRCLQGSSKYYIVFLWDDLDSDIHIEAVEALMNFTATIIEYYPEEKLAYINCQVIIESPSGGQRAF